MLVVEDGPTHHPRRDGLRRRDGRRPAGGRRNPVDPRPYAVGSIAETSSASRTSARSSRRWATRTSSCATSRQTINATDCDAVIAGTPIDLGRIVDSRHPIRHVTYELRQVEGRPIEELLAPIAALARG